MSRLGDLLAEYENLMSLPWKPGLSGKERVIFLVYDKHEERRMVEMVGEFELATKKAHHGWKSIDLSRCFSQWICQQEYKESYFESPEDLHNILDSEFGDWVVHLIHEAAAEVGPGDCLALNGTLGLFGFLRLSNLIEKVAPMVKGRLVVFFPGRYESNTYHFLDARDGWNYLAIPLTGQGGL